MTYKRRLVFVSYELYPVNPGGCGVFIWHALNQLLATNQYEITLLLDMPNHECQQFEQNHQGKLPNAHLLKIVCLSETLKGVSLQISLSDFQNIFLYKSYLFYQGLQVLSLNQKIDYIEFFDYAGIGYFSILSKKYEKKFQNIILGIRAHCTIDLMDAEQNHEIDLEKLTMYELEKISLQEVDIILAPSNAWRDLYSKRYNVNKDKVIISPPPVDLSNIPKKNKKASKPNVLFYGRIFQLKGVDIFVDAAVEFLIKNPNSSVKFYLVGYDGGDPNGGLYKEYLQKRIPQEYINQFIFTGQVKHDKLLEILNEVEIAIFPNYIESFSYSIHEIYYSGLPLIIRPIPAFNDYFIDDKNCIAFNGTIGDLTNKLKMLITDEQLRERLKYPYAVINNDIFAESYAKLPYNYDQQPSNKRPENQGKKISIIMLGNQLTQETIDYPEYISKEKSYRLYSKPQIEDHLPIWLLGQLWYAYDFQGNKLIDKSLSLEKYVFLSKDIQEIKHELFAKSMDILDNHKELAYVGSYFIEVKKDGTKGKNCVPFNILRDYTPLFYSQLFRSVLRVPDGRSLRDLFESRMNHLGSNAILFSEGYIIPEFLYKVPYNEMIVDGTTSSFITHQLFVNEEWRPSSLLPIWMLKQMNEKGIIQPVQPLSWKRVLYNEINSKLDSRKDILSLVLKKSFNLAVKLYKKLRL